MPLTQSLLRIRSVLQAESASEDLRAISRAMALCVFLWGIKVYLATWYVWVKGIPVLDETPGALMLLLGAADFAFCAVLAGVYWVLLHAVRLLPRNAQPVTGTLLTFFIHAAIVVFSVASAKVNQVYGWPLDIGHVRAAGELEQMSASLGAYLTVSAFVMLVAGTLSFPILSPLIRKGMMRIAPLRRRWALWGTLAVCAAVLSLLWANQLTGMYTYGLKKNAVLHFVQYYERAPQPSDSAAKLREMETLVGTRGQELLHPRSLRVPDSSLARDFTAPAPAPGFNVLMIVLESTSGEYIDSKTTPNLMALAETGVSFRKHYIVFSETYKAIYSLFYSDYMIDLGTHPSDIYARPLPQPSAMESVKQRGYSTAVFHSGFLNFQRLGYFWRDKGVDTMQGARELRRSDSDAGWMWGVFEERTVEVMSQWLKVQRDKPFFAVYSPMYPHHPYNSPMKVKPFPEDTWENKDRNSLYYADVNIGQLLKAVDETGARERTLVVVVADHGETVSSFPVGHGLAMTYEEIRVPFIISNPKLFPTAQQSHLSTNHLDVMPTLLSMLQITRPKEWLGRDLTQAEIEPRMLFLCVNQAKLDAVVDNGLLLVLDHKTQKAQSYALEEKSIRPLAAGELEEGISHAFEDKIQLWSHWTIWRHLKRAQEEKVFPRPLAPVIDDRVSALRL